MSHRQYQLPSVTSINSNRKSSGPRIFPSHLICPYFLLNLVSHTIIHTFWNHLNTSGRYWKTEVLVLLRATHSDNHLKISLERLTREISVVGRKERSWSKITLLYLEQLSYLEIFEKISLPFSLLLVIRLHWVKYWSRSEWVWSEKPTDENLTLSSSFSFLKIMVQEALTL